MKKLIKTIGALTAAFAITSPAMAQDAGALSGLSTLGSLAPLIEAAGDPAILPALTGNVANGLLGIGANGLADPSGLTGLSPLDLGSLDAIASGTLMIQNYPGGAALLPALGIVGPALGGLLGD